MASQLKVGSPLYEVVELPTGGVRVIRNTITQLRGDTIEACHPQAGMIHCHKQMLGVDCFSDYSSAMREAKRRRARI